jgi:hypothetical protein
MQARGRPIDLMMASALAARLPLYARNRKISKAGLFEIALVS